MRKKHSKSSKYRGRNGDARGTPAFSCWPHLQPAGALGESDWGQQKSEIDLKAAAFSGFDVKKTYFFEGGRSKHLWFFEVFYWKNLRD